MRFILLGAIWAISSNFVLDITIAHADGFGSRFGDTSPYALNNGFGKALDDSKGIGLEDLAKISPAAGGEQEENVPEGSGEKSNEEIEEMKEPDSDDQEGFDQLDKE